MEVFWSVRLLEWIALAGVVAAIRRAPARGAFVAVWFVMFCVVKGSSSQASISTTSYFRLTEPGLPAFVAARRGARLPRAAPRRRVPSAARRGRCRAGRSRVTAVVGALVPLVLVLALRRAAGAGSTVRDLAHSTEAPISSALAADGVRLGRSAGARSTGTARDVQYVVYRVDAGSGGCTAPTIAARTSACSQGTLVGTDARHSFARAARARPTASRRPRTTSTSRTAAT